MTLTASEFYEAGMALPPEVRKQVALRLLDSVHARDGHVDFDGDAEVEAWLRTDVAAAYDAVAADPSRTFPLEDGRAEFTAKWATRP